MMMARSKTETASEAAASSTSAELDTLEKILKMEASVYNLRQHRDAESGKEDISRYALWMNGSINAGPRSMLLRRERASA